MKLWGAATLLLLLLLCGLVSSSANIDNCNTERLVTELYACYTTENDPCGPDCASGYLTIRKWFCFCNCEECCLQKQYYVCDVCSSGYIATSDSLRCVDINECQGSTPSNPACKDGTTCTNYPGTYECGPCPPGTSGTGKTGCTPCPAGKWGDCTKQCQCKRGVCSPIDGSCDCTGTGYTGTTCDTPLCGDGILVGTEQCDGVNLDCCINCMFAASGTPCSSDNNPCTRDECGSNGACLHPSNNICICGNSRTDPGEECDGGVNPVTTCPYAAQSCTLCNANCKKINGITSFCSDSKVDPTYEQCDDGNTNNGDGCSSSCQLESGYTCSPGQPCQQCVQGKYGTNCAQTCSCQNGASCNPASGACTCISPWIGSSCNALPSVTADIVTGIPQTVYAKQNPLIQLTGAFASSITKFAFVLGTSCTSDLYGLTVYSNSNGVTLSSQIPEAREYRLCLSYNNGNSYVLQNLSPILVKAPPATSSSITSFSPLTFTSNYIVNINIQGQVPSATTKIAFSSNSNCQGVQAETQIPLGTGSFVPLGSAFTITGSFKVCYSTDNGANYVAQQFTVNVNEVPASSLSVLKIDPPSFNVGDTPELSLYNPNNDLITAGSINVAFIQDKGVQPDCSNSLLRVGETILDVNPKSLGSAINLAGIYFTCYKTSLTDFVLQELANAKIEIKPTPAAANSITSISPQTIYAFEPSTISFSGAIPSKYTFIAFVLSGNCDSNRLAVTPLSSSSGNVTVALSGTLPANAYKLCYSTDSGVSYVEQTGINLNVIAPPASSTAIIQLIPDSFNVGDSLSMTFVGAIPSSTTKISFIPQSISNNCSIGNRASTDLPSSSQVNIDTTNLFSDTYLICYSTDSGNSWKSQTKVQARVYAPPATATSITGLDKTTLTVGYQESITFTGLIPSTKTYIALTPSNCTYIEGATLANSTSTVTLSVKTASVLKVCYSTDSGVTWVLQTTTGVQIESFPPNATNTSISLISPNIIDFGVLESLTLVGGVPHSSVWFAFTSDPNNCASKTNLFATTNLLTNPKALSSQFASTGTYYLCYSTDSGDSYFGQESNKTILVVKAPDATPTSISSINIVNLKRDTSQFIVGVTFSIEAIGAVPSSRSILKFIQSSDCSGSGIEMPYNNSIVTMPTPFTSTGYYSICYSTDERGSWSLQNLVLFIYPPGATTTTITAVSTTITTTIPTVSTTIVYVLNPNAITFTGAIPSNQTKIAFVSKGIACINDNFLEKILLETKTATIPNSFPFAGLFEVCYSSDNGNSWFKQENIEVNAIPKAATATSITKIGHYGTKPTQAPLTLYVGIEKQNITVEGGIPSSRSKIGFVPISQGQCLKESVVGLTNFTNYNISIASIIPTSELHSLCYSVDDGKNFERQSSFFVIVAPPQPTSATITALSPPVIYAFRIFDLSATGAVPSAQTYIGFVPQGSECYPTDSSDPLYPFVIRLKYDTTQVSSPTFITTGTYTTCLSIDSGYSYTKQTSLKSFVNVLAPPATNRTITALSPPTLVATIVQIVIPIGAIASQTTYIGFTLSDCSNPESILAKTLFNQGSVNMTQALDAGTYHICYTTNSTLGWVMQLNAGDDNPISVKTELAAANPNESASNNSALIGGIVGGVGGLLLIVALIVGIFLYKRHKNLKKFEIFKKMEPATSQPAFNSQNPIFESSPMYDPATKDPFESESQNT